VSPFKGVGLGHGDESEQTQVLTLPPAAPFSATQPPRVDVREALLEIHAKTGFMDEFTHGSLEQSRVTDLPISVCAVLIASACNIGLKPVVRADLPALTRNRLAWVQQNNLRSETLIRAKLAGGSFPRQTLRERTTS